MFFLTSDDFSQLDFTKNLSGISPDCLANSWIQIRPDRMSGLFKVQTVCNCCQQVTKYITGG